MKKILSILLLAVFLFTVTSCVQTKETVDTDPPSAKESGEITDTEKQILLDEPSYKIQELKQYGGMGNQLKLDLTPESLDSICHIDADFDFSDEYPVFSSKYTYNSQAIEMFEIGDEEITLMQSKLDTFLPLLFNNDVSEKLTAITDPANGKSLIVESDNIEINSYVDRLTVNINDYSINEDDILTSSSSNTYIDAALKYMNITDPVVERYYNGVTDEDIHMYVISEKAADDKEYALNRNFNNVTVMVFLNQNFVQLHMSDIKFDINNTKYYSTIPYDAAVKYVLENYPSADPQNIKAEIRYSNTAGVNYYVPCYRLYMGSKDEGDTKYTVTDIVAVDFDLD